VERSGAADGELVFVTGHPGSTSRLFTYAELADSRDRRIPKALEWLKINEVLLMSYSVRTRKMRVARAIFLFGYQNSRKAYDGELAGLLDPAVFEKSALKRTSSRSWLLHDRIWWKTLGRGRHCGGSTNDRRKVRSL